MKKSILTIGVAVLAALTAVSCNNAGKKTPAQESEEATQIADSVLAKVDSIFALYADHCYSNNPLEAVLTKAEKASKPQGLFDLKDVDTLTTTWQKISAFAFTNIDNWVCQAHGDNSATAAVLAKLQAELNLPAEVVYSDTVSVAQKKTYQYCKDNGMLDYFWRMQYSMLIEISNVLAANPDAYLTKMTPSQLKAFEDSWSDLEGAVATLARYDENINRLYTLMLSYSAVVKPEGGLSEFTSMSDAKASFAAAKPTFETIRIKLLQ